MAFQKFHAVCPSARGGKGRTALRIHEHYGSLGTGAIDLLGYCERVEISLDTERKLIGLTPSNTGAGYKLSATPQGRGRGLSTYAIYQHLGLTHSVQRG